MGRRPRALRFGALPAPAALRLGAAMLLAGAGCEARDGGGAEETEAVAVAPGELVSDAAQYAGQPIRLERVAVASRLGPGQAFWIRLPGDVPYLIKLDAALADRGGQLAGGDVVSVSGVVREMNDSVLADWEQKGAIRNEGHRAEAQFAITFLEAAELRKH